MSENSRYSAPKAVVAEIASAREVQLGVANKALKRARLGFVCFFAGILAMGYIPPQHAPLMLIAMLLSLVLGHVYLGLAAVRSGRSWVWFALLPILAPVLGGLISFGVLRGSVPDADADVEG